jgi:hypothetical protein
VDGLSIPARLVSLIDAGIWPRNSDESNLQNSRCLVPKEYIHRFAPEEDMLFLYPPPFHTLTKTVAGGEDSFYSNFGALNEISPEASIEIADFGLGADATILLDYRHSTIAPRVIRLRWAGEWGVIDNHWVVCGESFDQFADMLELHI